jgi:glycosyltransferase involved in cell wall biosynthesis
MKVNVKKLIVMGGGQLESRNGEFYGKHSMIEYLHKMSSFYYKTVFMTRAVNRWFFKTPLDTRRVKVHVYRSSRSLLGSLYSDALAVREYSKANDVLMFVPNTWNLLLFPIVKQQASCVGIYTAGDWIKQPRRFGTKWAMRYALRNADVVFSRGHTYELARMYNENVWESMPIISFNNFSRRSVLSLTSGEERRLKLLTVCTLSKRKSIQYILRAIHKLISQDPKKFENIHLNIVGDGAERQYLEDETSNLNLSSQVQFHGYVDDPYKLKELYAGADFFIFHSFHEGQPRVLDEAVLHNVPIITADLVGIRKHFRNMENALFFEAGDVDEIARCIRKLAYDKELRLLLAENATNRYRSRFDFENAAVQHATLLHRSSRRGF